MVVALSDAVGTPLALDAVGIIRKKLWFLMRARINTSGRNGIRRAINRHIFPIVIAPEDFLRARPMLENHPVAAFPDLPPRRLRAADRYLAYFDESVSHVRKILEHRVKRAYRLSWASLGCWVDMVVDGRE